MGPTVVFGVFSWAPPAPFASYIPEPRNLRAGSLDSVYIGG